MKNTLASETTSMHCAVTALLLCCVFGVGTRSIHAQESPPPFNGPPVGENWINVQPAVEHGSGQCNGCRRCCPQSNGTLFRWSSAPNVAGGPNLDEPLVTDRPDFTEASSTVGLGVSQIEFGYTYVYGSSGDTSIRTQSFGEPLLRYGIGADWLEFRLGVFPLEEQTNIGTTSSSTSALSDMYLGVKIGLTPQAGILPEMAIIPQMRVPSGGPAFSAETVRPGVNWIYAWEINDSLSTAGSTQINRAFDGGTRSNYARVAQSWTVAASLTEEVGAYAEWFALIPTGVDTVQTQHYLNGGFTYLLSNDVQFDIRAGVGLNEAAEDYFVGTGLSVRFP